MKTGEDAQKVGGGGGKEVRKTDIAVEDYIKRPRKSGRRMEKKSNRQKELETVDRERNGRKVRGRKKKMEIMVNSP